MKKKTVNISEHLIKSVIIGLVIGLLIVFVVHFFGSWYATPPSPTSPPSRYEPTTSYTPDTKIPQYTLICQFDTHHYFEGNGASLDDIIGGHFNGIKFSAILSATFDEHWKHMFIIGLIVGAIIYALGKVNFKVVNE